MSDAQPTPGPAYADGRYVIANPDGGRPNGEAIMSPTGYGKDLPLIEQEGNAQLAAAAFNAAHELPDEYDPVRAVEALPLLIKAFERGHEGFCQLVEDYRHLAYEIDQIIDQIDEI